MVAALWANAQLVTVENGSAQGSNTAVGAPSQAEPNPGSTGVFTPGVVSAVIIAVTAVFVVLGMGATRRKWEAIRERVLAPGKRFWTTVFLPGQSVIVIPLCVGETLRQQLSGSWPPPPTAVALLCVGTVSLIAALWAQWINSAADSWALERARGEADVVEDLRQRAAFIQGVSGAFLAVVNAKANRVSDYLRSGPTSLTPKHLKELWNPRVQAKALMMAVWQVVFKALKDGGSVQVKLYLVDPAGEYVVPRFMFNGSYRNIATPGHDEKHFYRLKGPPHSIAAYVAQTGALFVVPDTAKAAAEENNPLRWCPCRQEGAVAAVGIPVKRQGEAVKGVVVIQTDEAGVFDNSAIPEKELKLLADNLSDRLLYELDADKLLDLLSEGVSQHAASTPKTQPQAQGGQVRGGSPPKR
jgi:hypothetical protein